MKKENYFLIGSVAEVAEKMREAGLLKPSGTGKFTAVSTDEDFTVTTEKDGLAYIWIRLKHLAKMCDVTEKDLLSDHFLLSNKFIDYMNRTFREKRIFPMRSFKVPTTKLND